MHNYKDAILSTQGSFILYPGDENAVFREEDGPIPSVGAFPLPPAILHNYQQRQFPRHPENKNPDPVNHSSYMKDSSYPPFYYRL